MASNINKVVISGNLGRDAELKSTRSGLPVLGFSMCVNGRVKRGDGWEDEPNWVSVQMFGRRAESIARYLTKGTHVCVSGRLNENTWERDGQKRSKLEIVADEIEFTAARQQEPPADVYAEDCPF